MTTPPRYLVLNEAESIVDDALAGLTEDRKLAALSRAYRAREQVVGWERQARAQWERIKLNPLFKLYVFYAVMIVASYLAGALQRYLDRRRSAPTG